MGICLCPHGTAAAVPGNIEVRTFHKCWFSDRMVSWRTRSTPSQSLARSARASTRCPRTSWRSSTRWSWQCSPVSWYVTFSASHRLNASESRSCQGHQHLRVSSALVKLLSKTDLRTSEWPQWIDNLTMFIDILNNSRRLANQLKFTIALQICLSHHVVCVYECEYGYFFSFHKLMKYSYLRSNETPFIHVFHYNAYNWIVLSSVIDRTPVVTETHFFCKSYPTDSTQPISFSHLFTFLVSDIVW